jgi:hypothetical protein
MFRVPAVPIIRSTILQLTVIGITHITLEREVYGNVQLNLTIQRDIRVLVCYTSDCQLQYCTPDDGYSRYPKHVEILQ